MIDARDPFCFDDIYSDVCSLAGQLTRWQRVIMGDCGEYRVHVALNMRGKWTHERAKRFALCGRGDQVVTDSNDNGRLGGGFRVVPHGCGERMCPRCSRRAGLRMLRVLDHRFRVKGHGPLWHYVQTQRVDATENLQQSYERLKEKLKAMRVEFKKQGVVGGLQALHVKRSRHDGWHIHAHVVFETFLGFSVGDLQLRMEKKFDDYNVDAMFCKRVSEGRTVDEVNNFSSDLYRQPDACGEALGYVIGDVVQGINAFPETDFETVRITEFIEWIRGRQILTTFGAWRGKMVEVEKEEAEHKLAVQDDADLVKTEVCLGTCDEVFRKATQGVTMALEFFRFMVGQMGPTSVTGRRLRVVLFDSRIALGEAVA